MRCREGSDDADVRCDLGEVDGQNRQRDAPVGPKALKSLFHAVRLALHRVDQHAGHVAAVDTPLFERVLRASVAWVVDGVRGREDLLARSAGWFQRSGSANSD